MESCGCWQTHIPTPLWLILWHFLDRRRRVPAPGGGGEAVKWKRAMMCNFQSPISMYIKAGFFSVLERILSIVPGDYLHQTPEGLWATQSGGTPRAPRCYACLPPPALKNRPTAAATLALLWTIVQNKRHYEDENNVRFRPRVSRNRTAATVSQVEINIWTKKNNDFTVMETKMLTGLLNSSRSIVPPPLHWPPPIPQAHSGAVAKHLGPSLHFPHL